MTEPAAQPTSPSATPPGPSSEQAIRRLFTATLIIGVSGSGKTSQAEAFAVYLWETYQRILLLYSWDGGAIPTGVQKRMKQGLIRFWRARTRSAEGLGIETLYLGSKGYWPKRINAYTGETSPAVELVPAVTAIYETSCAQGHPLQRVTNASLLGPTFCGTCKVMVSVAQAKIAERIERTKGFEAVGGVFYDSLTSMSQVVLEHMDQQRGQGLIGGEKSSFGGVVQSGSVRMGGNNRADIGFGQSRANQFVNNALSIPNLVEGPVFTALSTEATDEGGLQIVGAKLPGRAATEDATSWFGNVLEQGKITVNDDGKERVVLHLRPFTDKQGRRHLLKSSGSVEVTEMLIDPPLTEKQPMTNANLGLVFKLLDEDLRSALREELIGAPGISSEFMEYGEGGAAAPVVSAPALVGGIPALGAPVAVMGQPPIATPRARRPATPPAPAAASPVAAAVPVVAAEAPAPVQAGPPIMGAPGIGSAPPPPPGMKPPMRAPGS